MKTLKDILALKPLLVKAAQEAYDEWEQDEEGIDPMLGEGGICQDVAENMAHVLSQHGIDCSEVSANAGDQHVYVVAQIQEGVYEVDISPHVYETGGGYTWKKKPNVTFHPDHVMISLIDKDPQTFHQYSDSMAATASMAFRVASAWVSAFYHGICMVCKKDVQDRKDMYMVNDDLWKQLEYGLDDGVLCWDCLVDRVKDKLHRKLKKSDFDQYFSAPFNLGNPAVKNITQNTYPQITCHIYLGNHSGQLRLEWSIVTNDGLETLESYYKNMESTEEGVRWVKDQLEKGVKEEYHNVVFKYNGRLRNLTNWNSVPKEEAVVRVAAAWLSAYDEEPKVIQIEKELERKYHEGAPQQEIDRLETELAKHISEGGHDESDEDLEPGGGSAVSEGISIEEHLRQIYHKYLKAAPQERGELLEAMKSVIDGRDFIYTPEVGRTNSDQQVLDAAKDAYERHLHLLSKRKVPGLHPTPDAAMKRLKMIKERLKKRANRVASMFTAGIREAADSATLHKLVEGLTQGLHGLATARIEGDIVIVEGRGHHIRISPTEVRTVTHRDIEKDDAPAKSDADLNSIVQDFFNHHGSKQWTSDVFSPFRAPADYQELWEVVNGILNVLEPDDSYFDQYIPGIHLGDAVPESLTDVDLRGLDPEDRPPYKHGRSRRGLPVSVGFYHDGTPIQVTYDENRG